MLAWMLAALLVRPQTDYEARWTTADAFQLLDPAALEWERAQETTFGAPPYRTRFRALWSGTGLHLRFDSEDDDPWFTMTARDDPLWEEEVVEIFLDPRGDGRYIEVELNPANVVCDLRRLGPGETATDPIGPMDRGFSVKGMRTAVTSDEHGWTGTLMLPWTGLGLPGAPEPGSSFPFNVFRIKRPGGPEAPGRDAIFAAWSPTGSPSFHVPEAFRPLVLAPPR